MACATAPKSGILLGPVQTDFPVLQMKDGTHTFMQNSTKTEFNLTTRSWGGPETTSAAAVHLTMCWGEADVTCSEEIRADTWILTALPAWTVPAAEVTRVPVTVFGAERIERALKDVNDDGIPDELLLEDMIPTGWTLESTDGKCQSSASILAAFAVENIVVSLGAVLLGRRTLVNKITFGRFGKKKPSSSWRWMWLVTVAVSLAANAAVAAIFLNNPAVKTSFTFPDLMLLLGARPRLSWLFVTPLAFSISRRQDKGEDPQESQYAAAAISQSVGEAVLQIVAFVPMGKATHYGAQHGFYLVTDPRNKMLPPPATQMYAGSLCYVLLGSFIAILILGVFVRFLFSHQDDLFRRAKTMFQLLWVGIIATWVMSWLFWTGYVNLTGDL